MAPLEPALGAGSSDAAPWLDFPVPVLVPVGYRKPPYSIELGGMISST